MNAMEKHLDEKGIRFWRDIHNATAGRLEKVVDGAMRQNPTVLLVLSRDWSRVTGWSMKGAVGEGIGEGTGPRRAIPNALDDAWKDLRGRPGS